MADLTDRKQLEAWLETQPREVCVAIAARAVLRVLPTLEVEFNRKRKSVKVSRDIILPVIRTMALALAAATYPAKDNELRAAVALRR